MGTITDIGDKGRPYVRKNTEEEAAATSRQIARILAEWKTASDVSRDYHIGSDDVLELSVLSLEEPGKMSQLVRAVSPDGTINIPWVGAVKVVDCTAFEVSELLKRELQGRFIKEPQVSVTVSQFRSAPVVITGAVNKPGIYYLRSERRSVLELLAEADGLSAGAGNELLLVRSSAKEGETVPPSTNALPEGAAPLVSVDLKKLIIEGDLRLNVWVRKGDMITVPPRAREYIYVLGYVQRPGAFEVERSNPPGALQAVAMAGGLQSTARAENSFLLRETEKGQQMIPMDLTKIARGTRPTVALQAGDTLVVGSSFIARLSEFIRPSIGAGVSYAPVP